MPRFAAPGGDADSILTEDPLDRALHSAIGRWSGGFSPMALAEAWFDWTIHLAVAPARVSQIVASAAIKAGKLAELSASSLILGGACKPCEHSLPQDKRFTDPSWSMWPFALFAEAHLATERTWDEATSHIHGATQQHLSMLRFVGRQMLDVMAPSNGVLTNPEVLEATIRSGGTNLLRGAAYAFEDFNRLRANERPRGADAFRPGETVALSKGQVVQRTRLAEVIQYAPTTPTVRTEPLVIVPAWIMKYYVLDLQAHNSLVKHLVDAGFTVFMISWRNPDPEDADIGLDDYRREGVMPAISKALEITGARRAHAVGYCIGGTLLGLAAATMGRDGDERLQTLTFLAAQTDFREAGELRFFIDESQLAVLDDIMAEKGVLESSRMAGMFNLLRSNDLIWSRMVRHYLLGKREPMSDIAAWSSDATRMPARMHSEYLRSLYLNNDLAEGRFQVDGQPVSLRDISCPTFAVGTEWDHVAPWRSVFKVHMLTDSDVTFVLTNGGHNQGIISQPGRADRHFRIATTRQSQPHMGPDEWVATVRPHEGSWWPAWFEWLARHSSGTGPAHQINETGRSIPAPGRYVLG